MSTRTTVRALRYVDLLVPMKEGETREFESDVAHVLVALNLCEIVPDEKPRRVRKPQGAN